MKYKNFILTLLIAVPCGMIMSGCGATDWATREIPDGSSLDKGDLITIVQKNGILLIGTYRGLASLSPLEYADEYSRTDGQIFDGKLLPRIGQRIRILTTISDSRIWEGELVGFDCSSLWMKPDNSGKAERVYFTSLRCMTSRDYKVFHRMYLRNLFVDGDIPLMSAIEIEDGSGIHRIPVSSINYIEQNATGLVVSVNDMLMTSER